MVPCSKAGWYARVSTKAGTGKGSFSLSAVQRLHSAAELSMSGDRPWKPETESEEQESEHFPAEDAQEEQRQESKPPYNASLEWDLHEEHKGLPKVVLEQPAE